ncbi:MAG: metal-dependent transcriptional regulator [Desulfomonilaceae bacterium]|nr:metal-dependent transcriptional regulator [Desulfomonilaceae bacterium]
MQHANGLTPSRQCYLVEILLLEARQGRARQSEIAARIGVNRPSVTAALRSLAEGSFIRYEPYGDVALTDMGRQAAERIMTRRGIIRDYLVKFLDIDEGAADEAACRMQHALPDIVFDRLSARLGKPERDIR